VLLAHYERYLSGRFELRAEVIEEVNGHKAVKKGTLTDRDNRREYTIDNYIPRFTGTDNYAASFGLQWNKFKRTQFDSHTGRPFTAERLWHNTKWNPEKMRGKTLLEVGSGAGRFTEVLLQTGGLEIVSFDFSSAVDANYESNKSDRLLLFQGDLHNLPLEKKSFDYVFCYGVLQHTPHPEKSFYAILDFLKPGGHFSVDVYRKMYKPSPWYFPKYFWRPIATKLKPATLLKIVEFYVPLWLPIDTFIKKLPGFGSFISGMVPIPCWNYLHHDFTYRQRVEWAIMDTFDALAAKYDIPKTMAEVNGWCRNLPVERVEIFYGSNGIVVNGRKIALA
jgi:ubiquinone/menaquinone biosynthesis C-methylase UbiE